MSKLISIWMMLGAMLLSKPLLAETADSCEQPGRITSVCYQMKHLRSHIMLLDAQRDLVQGNYEMIKAVPVYVTEYADELIPATDQSVSYFLTSVDSEGRESPRSASVWY